MASLSALHVTAEPAAHAEKHIMQYWKMNLFLWPLFSVALRTRSPTGWTECVDILKCVSLSLLLSLMPFLSPSWRFFFDFRLPVILSCLFFFFSPSFSSSSSSAVSPQVPPVVSRSSLATVPCGVSREEESGRSHSTKKGAFHEIFNLQESERPLAGKGTSCSMKKTLFALSIPNINISASYFV